MAGSRLGAVPFRAALIFYAISVSAAYGQSQTNVQFDQTGDPAIRTEAGWAALGTRNYDRAREDFIVALRSDPNFFEARRGLARTEAAQGRYREALSLIEPLRAVSPSFMLDQAVLLLLDDQPDQALAVIRPDFTKALHMLRGDVLYRMGGYDAALDEFEAANEVIEGADAWRAIGDSHDALGALNVAKEAYTRALELRRFDGTAYQRMPKRRSASTNPSVCSPRWQRPSWRRGLMATQSASSTACFPKCRAILRAKNRYDGTWRLRWFRQGVLAQQKSSLR